VHLSCAIIGFCDWFPPSIDSWRRSTIDRMGNGRLGDYSYKETSLHFRLR
jgi:hypothetical protein